MPDDVTPERIAMSAAAARVPLEPAAAARVARAVAPTVARFAAGNLSLPLEIEPVTFVAIARKEIAR